MLRIVVLLLLWTNPWQSSPKLLQFVKLLPREDRSAVWQYRQSGCRQLSRRVALRSRNFANTVNGSPMNSDWSGRGRSDGRSSKTTNIKNIKVERIRLSGT
jgi:hypothetical protein